MHITPIMPPHRPQLSDAFTGAQPPAASDCLAASTGARRQNKLDNKASNSQTHKIQKGQKINDKVQRHTFHNIHPKKIT